MTELHFTSEKWTQIYKNNFQSVKLYVLGNNGSVEQAEDVYHEAFIAAWRNVQLGRFELENDYSFTAYLLKIAKNKWIDYLRSGHFRKTTSMDENSISEKINEDHNTENNEIELIKKQFSQLDDPCKELLNKFYYEKRSMREISELFGWTEATARNNKYRCLQKLRAFINQHMP